MTRTRQGFLRDAGIAAATLSSRVDIQTASAETTMPDDWTPSNPGCWLLTLSNYGSSTDGYLLREAQLGRKFAGRLHFKSLGTTDVSDMKISSAQFGSIGYPIGAGTQAVYDIAAGRDDAKIHGFAQAVKRVAPLRIFLRLFWEFNLGGSKWYPPNYTMNGSSKPGTPADIIAAWRRVYGIFQSEGVTNVRFAWNSGKIGRAGISQYWPGGDVVDWCWVDCYPNVRVSGGMRLDPPAPLVDPWYKAVKGYGKPLGIGEFDVHPVDDAAGRYVSGISPLRRTAWWPLWVPYLKTRPEFHAVTVFEAGVAQHVDHNWVTDYPSKTSGDSGSQAFAAYKAFALDPYMNPAATA